MENIFKILEEKAGLTLPEDKKKEFETAFLENYRTVNELNGLRTKLTQAESENTSLKTKYDEDISKRDTDLSDLRSQLESAGTSEEELKKLQEKFNDLNTEYTNAKSQYETSLAKEHKSNIIRGLVDKLEFTSNGAKKAFLSEVLAKDLQLDGDTVLGFDDYTKKYAENDPGAFKEQNKMDNKRFSGKSTKGTDNPDDKEDDESVSRLIVW